MKKISTAYDKFLGVLDAVSRWLCAILLAVMVLIITAQVVLRWFGVPLSWSIELAQILFVEATFFGCYLGARRGKQILVDMLQEKLPYRGGCVLYTISHIICLAFFTLIAWTCFAEFPVFMLSKTPIMNVRTGYLYLGIATGSVLLALASLGDLLRGKPKKEEVAAV